MAGVLAEPTFLGVRADEWSALGVWFTGLVTLGLLLYAARQLHQASQIRDEQSRPYVVVDFHGRSIMISLSVKNIGQTAATDVRVILDERLASAVMPDVKWQDSGLFATGVPLFAPGREMRFAVDVFPKRTELGLPMVVTGTVKYWRPHRRGAEICEPFRIDMAAYAEALMPPKDIADLGDELEKIRKLFEKRETRAAHTERQVARRQAVASMVQRRGPVSAVRRAWSRLME